MVRSHDGSLINIRALQRLRKTGGLPLGGRIVGGKCVRLLRLLRLDDFRMLRLQ